MKRFHVHLAVDDLAGNIAFYSKLFGQPPARQKEDYAKWMLEDPRLNFAISSRGHAAGLNHFGMQTDSAAELEDLAALAEDASNGTLLDRGQAACCYAVSEKHWIIDPQGVPWEHFHTMADAETFGTDVAPRPKAGCGPETAARGDTRCCD